MTEYDALIEMIDRVSDMEKELGPNGLDVLSAAFGAIYMAQVIHQLPEWQALETPIARMTGALLSTIELLHESGRTSDAEYAAVGAIIASYQGA